MLSHSDIIGIFHSHPLMLMGRCLIAFSVMSTLFWIIFLFAPEEIKLLCIAWVVLFAFGVFVNAYIHWKLNTDIVTKEKLICIRFHGLFRFSIEDLSLFQVKTIHMKQEGFFQNIFSYGNIYIASEFYEEKSHENVLILKNVYPAEGVLSTIKNQVDIYRNAYGME